MASTWRSGERMGCPKPSKMHGRSYKNRCRSCLGKSSAENVDKMEPGNATKSKCEPLLSIFEGSGVPSANEHVRFGVDLASTGRSGEPVGGPKPCQMHRRSYKNRCWRCLCKSFAENAYNMSPRSAVRSKCEPLLSVFEGSGVPGANEDLRFGVGGASTGGSGEPKTLRNAA